MNNIESFFYKKKVLILVPHQDDETNICGGILKTLVNSKCDIYTAYSTNGDYSVPVKVRYKEAIKAHKKLGVRNPNIILLGYSDQYSEEDSHLYMVRENKSWVSRNNKKLTFGTKKCMDFRFNVCNYHNPFNYNSFISDIIMLIEHIKPDIIFSIDFDSHPDHRALCLGLDKALGIVLKDDNNYCPIVYKTFAYPTAYFGQNDFNSINIKSTTFRREKNSEFLYQNPYYSFYDRVRFPVHEKSKSKCLLFNNVYKALKCHKSQVIVSKTFSIINGDQIFWQKRTDNLVLNSKIGVSSGEAKYLNDFITFDCDNIMNGQNEYAHYLNFYWKPTINDKEKKIDISFNRKEKIDELCIYQPCGIPDRIKTIGIFFDDVFYCNVSIQDELKKIVKLKDPIEIKKVSIKLLKVTGKNAGISEIEIFPLRERNNLFIKIMNNEDFIYNNYYNEGDLNIKIYSYNGYESKILDKDEYQLLYNNKPIDEISINNIKDGEVKAILKENNNILDSIKIKKCKKYNLFKNNIINYSNYFFVEIHTIMQKILRKIKKMIKIYS